MRRANRSVGFNHIALEVGDVEEADLLRQHVRFRCAAGTAWRSRPRRPVHRAPVAAASRATTAAISAWSSTTRTRRQALIAAGVELLPGPFLDFRDSGGNRIEIIGYGNIQFTGPTTSCAAWASPI